VVARALHGRRFALRYAIAAAAAWLGGGIALYLVELPAAAFVVVNAIAVALLGLIFFRAEDVARTRAVDEPGRATLELVGGLVSGFVRWLLAAVRRQG
jgi:hypothetical protein